MSTKCRPQLHYTGLLSYRITFRIGLGFHLHYHAVIRYNISEQNHSALELIQKVIRYVPCRKLSCVNGVIRYAPTLWRQISSVQVQLHDEDARVYSCKFNADEFLPFSYNYWLLFGKKKIAKYSVFLVPSVGISGAEQCNCQYFCIGLG